MPYAELAGLRLYYEVHGDGEPLVCVMGLGADATAWDLQVPEFGRHFRTVVFDNRDAGRSSYADRPYGVRDMSADAIALADALELPRFHLLGLSMGGAIAQEVALAVPDRVLTLTLAVSYAGSSGWVLERARLETETIAQKSDELLVDEHLLRSFSETMYEQPSRIAYIRKLMLSYPHRQRRDGYLRQLAASSRHEARDRLSALKMPAHVIGAEHDLRVPVWKSRQLAELIPGARLSIVAGAGHAVNVERPEDFTALVLDFLRDPQPTRI
jgi:3-oxoadipate enol-lactonase